MHVWGTVANVANIVAGLAAAIGLALTWHGWQDPRKKAWCATFFNTVEYLCFLVNHKLVHQEALEHFFFSEALPDWWKQFQEYTNAGLIADSGTNVPEMRAAFQRHESARVAAVPRA
jgi:hypothetical protein